MEEKKIEGIPLYRMCQIVKVAAAATDLIINGKYLYNPTYHECEIAVELIQEAIKKSKNEYRRK